MLGGFGAGVFPLEAGFGFAGAGFEPEPFPPELGFVFAGAGLGFVPVPFPPEFGFDGAGVLLEPEPLPPEFGWVFPGPVGFVRPPGVGAFGLAEGLPCGFLLFGKLFVGLFGAFNDSSQGLNGLFVPLPL